jgi:hypothetical protein
VAESRRVEEVEERRIRTPIEIIAEAKRVLVMNASERQCLLHLCKVHSGTYSQLLRTSTWMSTVGFGSGKAT